MSTPGSPLSHSLKILLLNQAFYPDVVATSQHLTELAVALVERGHQVTVIAGRRAYDNPERRFSQRETWRGVEIIRVDTLGLGKSARWKRALDFAAFMVRGALQLAILKRPDVVVALTSPPLISFLGALLAKIRGTGFVYWVMDFNPDEAIAAGWLRANSAVARLLDCLSRFSLLQANRIIALDRFMCDRVVAKGINPARIEVLPPWSHDNDVRFDETGRTRFRERHGLNDKFVVMYSGNHSPCHPLDTLLAAARQLSDRDDVRFLFVGGGSQLPKVKDFAAAHALTNVICLPYQSLDQLSASLSAADLHVVVMGDPFVGLVHPCKIYNILHIGSPLLYIGPRPSHLTDLIEATDFALPFISARHGEVDQVVNAILDRSKSTAASRIQNDDVSACTSHSRAALLPRLVNVIESCLRVDERNRQITDGHSAGVKANPVVTETATR